MDFDHRDPSTKSFALSGKCLLKSGEALLREVAKCDVVGAKLPPPQNPGPARIIRVELAEGRRLTTTTRQDGDPSPSSRAAQAAAQCTLP